MLRTARETAALVLAAKDNALRPATAPTGVAGYLYFAFPFDGGAAGAGAEAPATPP